MDAGLSLFEDINYDVLGHLFKIPFIDLSLEISYDFVMQRDIGEILERLKSSAGGRALRLSMHGPIQGTDISCAVKSVRLGSLEKFKRCFELAERLRCKYAVVHTNSYGAVAPEEKMERMEAALASIEGIAVEAQNTGVEAVVENVGFLSCQSLLFNEAEYKRIFSTIKGVYALLDTGHAFINGWNIPKLMLELDGAMRAMHIHDNDGHEDLHQRINREKPVWKDIFSAYFRMCKKPRLIAEYLSLPEISSGQLLEDFNFMTYHGKFV